MAQKVEGIKFNPVSIAELVGAVILFLIGLPLALSAWSNYSAGHAYDKAVDKYQIGNFVETANQLKQSIAARPENYYPHELLAMTLYNQREPNDAEAKYKELASKQFDDDEAAKRRPLAELAVACLQLMQAKEKSVPLEDAAYTGPADQVRKLAKLKTPFLEPRIVATQLTLDQLSAEGTTPSAAKTIIETAKAELEKIERDAGKGSQLSTWGAAVLFNSLGLVNFHQAVADHDRLSKLNHKPADKLKKFEESSKQSALAVEHFRRAVQYKLDWTSPWINLERALAFKLVEQGLANASIKEYDAMNKSDVDELKRQRMYWIYYAEEYVDERGEHLGNLQFGRGLKPSEHFKIAPQDNFYALINSLGWGYSMCDEQAKASSHLRSALRINGAAGIADYNLARTRAQYWKTYEGLIDVSRNEVVNSRQETEDFTKEALKNSGTTADPLRRVRLYNNFGVFLFKKGDPNLVGAANNLELALDHYGKSVEGTKLAREAQRQKLGESVRSNLKDVYQAILDSNLPANIKGAYRQKLEDLERK